MIKVSHKYLYLLLIGVVVISLQSCNDLLGSIYDKPTDKADFGFVEFNNADGGGVIYIDATQYSSWVYIDFHNYCIDSMTIGSAQPEPASWDLAIHRYDAKTNDGSVATTSFSDINMVSDGVSLTHVHFVGDEWSKVAIDMSDMINDNIIYAESNVNRVLSAWIDVDTRTMPPVYTLSGKVYLVRFADQSVAAVRLKDFMSRSGDKGYLTIEYVYPLKIK